MIVSITTRVEVDPEAWALTYGDCSREDVKRYVQQAIADSAAAAEGAILDVTVKR
jgi:hypothetical protein